MDDPINTAPQEETKQQEEEPPTVVETEPPTEPTTTTTTTTTTTEEEKDPIVIELPEFPVEVQYGNQGKIEITDLSYDYDYTASSGEGDLEIEFKSEIVVTTTGLYGFKLKLLEDGFVIGSWDYWFSGSYDEGDLYKNSFTLYNIPSGQYELQLVDY